MTDDEEREFALREADRMRVLASQYRQLGFPVLSAWLRQNADAALRWAGRKRKCQTK
jgi:hypothetical protein